MGRGPAHAPDVLDWFEKMYELGLKDLCDIVAMHPYVWHDKGPEWESGGRGTGSMKTLGEIKKIMDAHGDGEKPMWATEFGWEAEKVGAGRQAECLAGAWRIMGERYPFVKNAFWFEFVDHAVSGGRNQSYGLLKRGGPPFERREAAEGFLRLNGGEGGR